MSYAICYTKPDTTLTFWLNQYRWGGYIWSLVRSTEQSKYTGDDQYWNQPALRFASLEEAGAFLAQHLGGNPSARVVPVED